MPIRPKTIQRPWLTKIDYDAMPGQGRRFINPFYNSMAWKRFRAEHIKAEPVCRECLKRDKVVKADVVDHIKPINQKDACKTENGRFGEPLDHGNAQSLCNSCHAVKSARERHKSKIT